MKQNKTYMSDKSTNVKYVAPFRVHNIAETTANEFHFNCGEGLPWHSHDVSHLTMCIIGKCIVRVEGHSDRTMDCDTPSIILPLQIPHEIEAIVPNTIVINIYT